MTDSFHFALDHSSFGRIIGGHLSLASTRWSSLSATSALTNFALYILLDTWCRFVRKPTGHKYSRVLIPIGVTEVSTDRPGNFWQVTTKSYCSALRCQPTQPRNKFLTQLLFLSHISTNPKQNSSPKQESLFFIPDPLVTDHYICNFSFLPHNLTLSGAKHPCSRR